MKKKKRLSIMMVLATAIMLSGCGKQKDETTVKTENTEDEYIYVADYHVLGDAGRQVSQALIGNDQNIFYLEYSNEKVHLISMDISSLETKELPLELGENQYISCLNADGEGNLLAGVIGYTGRENAEIEEIFIKKLDADGKESLSLDLSEILLQQPSTYLSNILLDGDGNYYVCTGEEIFVVKPDGSLYSRISP